MQGLLDCLMTWAIIPKDKVALRVLLGVQQNFIQSIFVITVTSSPISMDTPSPTVSTNGSDDVTSEDEVDTCKNNAVITSLDTSGSIQITTQAAHGACAILSDSSIIYYPIPNYLGGDSCGYSVCLDSETSGELTCTEGSLNVSVVECPIWGLGTQSPVANEDAPTMSPTCDYAVSK